RHRYMGLSFDGNRLVRSVAAEGQIVDQSGRLHAWNWAHSQQHLLEEGYKLFKRVVPRTGYWQSHLDVAVHIKARINTAQHPKTAYHKTGSDQQNQRQGDFGYDQRRTSLASGRSCVCPSESLFQRIVQI